MLGYWHSFTKHLSRKIMNIPVWLVFVLIVFSPAVSHANATQGLARHSVAVASSASIPLFPSNLSAMCPDKHLGYGKVEGTFQWNECGGDFCHTSIMLDSGHEFLLMCGEEESELFYGSKVGQRVLVEYDVLQFWNDPGGECTRTEFCKGGRILSVR